MTLSFRNGLLGLASLLLLATLTACALGDLVNSPSEQGQEALDNFVRALRLGEYTAASSYLVQENRQAFLDTFEPIRKDLTIIDVEIQQIVLTEEGRSAAVTLEMEYYLLPSAAVKTFRFDQTWTYFDDDRKATPFYLIETPFPTFP